MVLLTQCKECGFIARTERFPHHMVLLTRGDEMKEVEEIKVSTPHGSSYTVYIKKRVKAILYVSTPHGSSYTGQ